MSSQVPLFSLSTPSQYPVMAIVDGATGNPANLTGYVTPYSIAAIIAAVDVRYLGNNASTVAVANRAFYYKIPTNLFSSLTITKLRVYVQTASGNMDVGVYSDNAGAPGAKKVTNGGVVVPATGAKDIAVASTVVNPGDWLAISADNITATFFGNGGTMVAGIGALSYYQDTAYPLPATATPILAAGRTIYIEGRP